MTLREAWQVFAEGFVEAMTLAWRVVRFAFMVVVWIFVFPVFVLICWLTD